MKSQSTRARLLASSILCVTAFAAAGVASAQEAGSVDEVIVTGSRIARQDYVANSPIVTVGEGDIQRTGSPTVEALLQQSPQFVASLSQTANNPSNGGQANIDLRGLGTNRTLVLVDGRRTTPSNADGTVDINTIPDALIENIEIITGGASSTYGSDAISGVVNFKLKKNFQGVELKGQYGISDRRDGQTDSVSLTVGGNFADDRGNAVVSLGYANRDLIYNGARPLTLFSGGSSTNPLGSINPSATNAFSQAAVDAYFGQAANGSLAAGTVKFNAARFNFNGDGRSISGPLGENYKGPTTPDYATIYSGIGGAAVGQGSYNTGPLNYNTLPLTRYSVYSRASYDVTDLISVWAEGRFNQYTASSELAASPASGNPNVGQTGFWVPASNPFLPADVRAILASRPSPNAPFLFAKRFNLAGGRHSTNDYTTYQMTLGIDGKIPALDWNWNAFMSQGRVQRTEIQTGNVSHGAVRTLLEADDGGASICAGGLNLFGVAPISAACSSYIQRTSKNLTTLEQRNFEANLSGGLFDLPAGEVKFAVGVDYISNDYNLIPDGSLSGSDVAPAKAFLGMTAAEAAAYATNAPSVIGFNASNPLTGYTDTSEVYGELLVPIIKDFPLVQEFNLNIGGRISTYNTVGTVGSYKGDFDWKVIDSVRFRGGYSRAIRAPSVSELYAPNNNNFPTVGNPGPAGAGDPCDVRSAYRTGPKAAQVRALCIAQGLPASIADNYNFGSQQVQAVTGGNPNLNEETANTYSVGMVWRPQFDMPLFSNLSGSIDYYQIKVSNVISSTGVETGLAIQYCYNYTSAGLEPNPTYSASNPFCSLFSRDPATGNIINGKGTAQNLGYIKTAGTDFQLDWKFGLGDIGLNDSWGSLSINLMGTKLRKYDQLNVPGINVLDRKAGTVGSAVGSAYPDWKTTTTVTYSLGPVDIGARWRFIDNLDRFTGGVATPEYNYFDLDGRWRVNDMIEWRIGVNNVGDKLPPAFQPSQQGNTDPATYDTIGRRYYTGFNLRF